MSHNLPTLARAGNLITVDAVFGTDAAGARGGPPFSTVAAALAVAVSGDVVLVQPGTYTLAAGVTIPTGVSLTGLNHTRTTLRMVNVTADTVLVTMGVNTSVENLTLSLTSAEHHTLTGVLFPGTTAILSILEGVTVVVDNSTAGDAGASNVYRVRSTGTGVPFDATSSLSSCQITVTSAGLGNKRGILVDTAAGALAGINLTVDVTRTGVAAGSYIGAEVSFAGARLTLRTSTVSGLPTADISQTAGTLTIGASTLVNATANGLGFSTTATAASFTWGDPGATPSGVRYMYLGTASVTTTEIKITFRQPTCLFNLTITAATGPGSTRTDAWTVRKNGVNTGLVVTLTDGVLSAENTTVSVAFAAGDQLSLQQNAAASSGTTNVQVTVNYT